MAEPVLRSSCLDPCDCGLSVMLRESLLELRVSSEGAAASQLFRVAFTKLGALPCLRKASGF